MTVELKTGFDVAKQTEEIGNYKLPKEAVAAIVENYLSKLSYKQTKKLVAELKLKKTK